MQTAQLITHQFIDQLVIDDRRFPTQPADKPDTLHRSINRFFWITNVGFTEPPPAVTLSSVTELSRVNAPLTVLPLKMNGSASPTDC
ncbi:MAG: hypothetical protein U0528_05205 [Anaerolineae bacterium]